LTSKVARHDGSANAIREKPADGPSRVEVGDEVVIVEGSAPKSWRRSRPCQRPSSPERRTYKAAEDYEASADNCGEGGRGSPPRKAFAASYIPGRMTRCRLIE